MFPLGLIPRQCGILFPKSFGKRCIGSSTEQQLSSNRVAIVTGASRGIGAAVCEDLMTRGVRVVGVARSLSPLMALQVKYPKLFFFVEGDVEEESTIRKALMMAGNRLDALVLNAGHVPGSFLISTVREDPLTFARDWAETMRVNALAPILWASHALPALAKAAGRVIYVSSAIGTTMAFPGQTAYSASKAAANAFVRVLAAECEAASKADDAAGSPLSCVLAVSPGVVRTEAFDQFTRGIARVAPQSRQALALANLRSVVAPVAVAPAISTLALHAPKEKSGQFVEWDADWVKKL